MLDEMPSQGDLLLFWWRHLDDIPRSRLLLVLHDFTVPEEARPRWFVTLAANGRTYHKSGGDLMYSCDMVARFVDADD